MQHHGLTLAQWAFYCSDWEEPDSGWALNPRPVKNKAEMSTKCIVTLRITFKIRKAVLAATGVNALQLKRDLTEFVASILDDLWSLRYGISYLLMLKLTVGSLTVLTL